MAHNGNVSFRLHRYGKTGCNRSVGGKMVQHTSPKYASSPCSTGGWEMI